MRAANKRSGSDQSGVSTDGRQIDFLYITNDGTRGPFVDTEYVEVRLIIVVMSLSSFFLLFSALPQNALVTPFTCMVLANQWKSDHRAIMVACQLDAFVFARTRREVA